MKFYLIFIFALGSLQIVGQTGKFTIQGHSDLPERTIYLVRFNGALGLDIQSDTIPANSKGEFSFNYYLQHPEFINLIYGKQKLRLWIKPKSFITLKLTDSGSVITGPMSIYANYYIESRKRRDELFQEYERRNPGYRNDLSINTDAYFRITDSITQGQLNYLNSYFTKSNLPGANKFIEIEKASILYEDMYYKVTSADTSYRKISFFQKNLNFTGSSTYGFSKEISMDERKLLPLYYYQEFVSSAIPRIADV